jgi:hypothetical protein
MRARWLWLGALGAVALGSGAASAQELGPLPFNAQTVPRISLSSSAESWPGMSSQFSPVYSSVFDRWLSRVSGLTEAAPRYPSAVQQPGPIDTVISPAQAPSWINPGVPSDAGFSIRAGPVSAQPVIYATPPPVAGEGRFQQSVLPSLVITLPFLK